MIDSIAVATEDALSEAVALRLLKEVGAKIDNPLLLKGNGFGYLKKNMHKWCKMAQRQRVLILTDLDQMHCPVLLKNQWLSQLEVPKNLLFRIAVREVESWILADHNAIRSLLGTKGKMANTPDALDDPKQYLLRLAMLASKDVRDDLMAAKGSKASQGIGYNNRLCELVMNSWNPVSAAERSPSLAKALARLDEWINLHKK